MAKEPAPVNWLNLSNVITRHKGTNDPVLILKWNSNIAETSALATPIVEAVSVAAGLGTAKAMALQVGPLSADPGSIAATPRADRTGEYLPMRWTRGGTRAAINFGKLFSVWPFEVPRGAAAHIPVSRADLPGAGPCLLFHFSKAEYYQIAEGKQKAARKAKREAAASRQAGA